MTDRPNDGMPPVTDIPDLVTEFLERYYAFSPHEASSFLGLHRYDGIANDRSQQALDGHRTELRDFQARIANAQERRAHLNPSQQLDLDLLDYMTAQDAYSLNEGAIYSEQPLAYVQFDVISYLKRDYAPFEARARHAVTFLRASLSLLEQARTNLKPVLPKAFLEVAIGVSKGYVAYYSQGGEFFSDLGDNLPSSLLHEAREVAAQVSSAVAEFVTWLEGRLANATDDFALGRERYKAYLKANELVEIEPEALLEIGEADLRRNLDRLNELVGGVMPGLSVADAIKEMGKNHPTAAGLIPDTAAMLERIRTYLIQKHIVSVPSEVRCTVAQTPSYYPAEAFASMDPPGPFETVATEAFYYVNGPKADWSAEKQEEWLTTFAYTNLEDISIHEAYPGHYVQLLWHQRAPTDAAKSTFNYAFVEGWAHYCEQMMIAEEGYGDGDPKLEIAQKLEALVRNVRFVCSIRMHTQGMTVAQATTRFIEEAHLAPAAAEAEATRGTYDPGYLAYTLGKLQILKLREDYKAEKGAEYSLHTFHDKLLSFGSPPVALIRSHILAHDTGAVL